MLSSSGLFNLVAMVATLVSLFFLIQGWLGRFSRDVNIVLFILLGFTLAYHTLLALEWFGIDTALDAYEDIIGALVPMWWGVVFYGLFTEVVDRERRQAEEALRQSERFLNTIVENIPDMIFVKDAKELRFVSLNEAGEKLLGYSRAELIGRNDHDFFPKEQADFFTQKDREVLRQGRLHEIPAEAIQTRDRGIRILNTKKLVLPNEDGQAEYLLGISEDITEKLLADKEVEQWARIFENAGWGVAVISPDGSVLETMNPAYARMHGYAVSDLKGSPVSSLVAPDCRESLLGAMESTGLRGHQTLESVHCRKDGTTFPVQIDVTFVRDETDHMIYRVANVQDITDRKMAEEQRKQLERRLRQSQKMESIGTLAGGIAHDFNNILGAIFGYTEIAQIGLEATEARYQQLQQVIRAAERAKELVRQILTFSRQAEVSISPVMIDPIVKEAVRFLRSSIPTMVDIRQDVHAVNGAVLADPTQVHQVIINLGTNAAHAMKEKGGILEVKTTEIFVESGLAGSDLKPGRYLQLVVSDTGHGMDKKTMERIFEPYFTTKDKDEGTGLGLAVVHGIVKSHGGEIKVYSEPDQGTTFQVYLPLIEQAMVVESSDKTDIPTGHEKIMFIDDEQVLVDVALRLLEHLGYTVETYTDSRKALGRIRSDPYGYDLIITDQTMPEVTGTELAMEAMKIRPEIPVILCTGFSQTISAIKAKDIGIKGFLMKPLALHDLAVTVRNVLDQGHCSR